MLICILGAENGLPRAREVSRWLRIEILLLLVGRTPREDFSGPVSGTGTMLNRHLCKLYCVETQHIAPVVALVETQDIALVETQDIALVETQDISEECSNKIGLWNPDFISKFPGNSDIKLVCF